MKRFFVLPLIAAGYLLNAQTIGNSPYAAFGIGDVKYDNTTDISTMGGISTAYIWDFNNSFNFSNPAANKNLELTTLKIEGSNENNFFKSNQDNMSVTKHSTYLSNVTIAFPISSKVKFGMGYQPYSSKKYTVLTNETLASGSTQASLYRGDGTISTVQAALSYQITPEFALGLRSNFFFGNLYDINELTFSDAELINGYETKNNISIIDEKYSEDKNLIPMEFSLGAGYGKDGKWFLGTQVDYKKGETIQFLGQPFVNENSYKVSAGGWYLPNYNNFRNYFSRVTYRYGAYYEKGNLAFNGTNVNQFAITGGMSFPFENRSASRMSGIDLGIELGKRGTLDNNLIRQNFINLKIGINFADKWFNKRLYD